MKKKLLLTPPLLFLIALLFPLLSANPIDSPKPLKEVMEQKALTNSFKNKISNRQRHRLVMAIESYFSKAIKEQKIVGAGIGIVKCDSTIYVGGFGKRNASLNNTTINDETIFRIGSVSKGFAGILSGIFVEEGLLDWDDKVLEHVPSFQLKSKKRTNAITLSHILSHTSGLPYHSYTNLVEDGLDIDVIASKFKSIKSIRKPGSVYNYQNAIFALSGSMIENVAGKSYGEVIEEKIFKPLQMNTASTDYKTLQSSSNIAMPHVKHGRGWRSKKINQKYYHAIPAGGINASVTDMAQWMRFLLGHNPNVMSTETLQKVFNPIVNLPANRNYYQKWKGHKESYYGYGWRIHDFVDKITGEHNRVIHHGGSVNDYRSEIAIFPQEDLGITVLFNSTTKLAKRVIPDLHKIIKEIMEMPEEELLVAATSL